MMTSCKDRCSCLAKVASYPGFPLLLRKRLIFIDMQNFRTLSRSPTAGGSQNRSAGRVDGLTSLVSLCGLLY